MRARAAAVGPRLAPDRQDPAPTACPRVPNGDYTRFLNPKGLAGARLGLARSGFVDEGERVFLLGETREELSGSEWAHVIHGHLGGLPPQIDLGKLRAFKDGVIKEQIVGNTTKDTISKMIDNHL